MCVSQALIPDDAAVPRKHGGGGGGGGAHLNERVLRASGWVAANKMWASALPQLSILRQRLHQSLGEPISDLQLTPRLILLALGEDDHGVSEHVCTARQFWSWFVWLVRAEAAPLNSPGFPLKAFLQCEVAILHQL